MSSGTGETDTRVASRKTAVVGHQGSPPDVKDLRQSHRPNPLSTIKKTAGLAVRPVARGWTSWGLWAPSRLEKGRCRTAAVQTGQAEAP